MADTTNAWLSCFVLSASTVWTEMATKLFRNFQSPTENFETVLSSLEMRCELSLSLSWPSFQFATWLPTATSYLETGSRASSQMHLHHRQDWTKLFSLQYIEDYWKLSATVANSVHTADAEEKDNLVLIAVWNRHNKSCLSVCVCLCVNQRVTNHNRRTQRLVILHGDPDITPISPNRQLIPRQFPKH